LAGSPLTERKQFVLSTSATPFPVSVEKEWQKKRFKLKSKKDIFAKTKGFY
jgi:hypothetical protein